MSQNKHSGLSKLGTGPGKKRYVLASYVPSNRELESMIKSLKLEIGTLKQRLAALEQNPLIIE